MRTARDQAAAAWLRVPGCAALCAAFEFPGPGSDQVALRELRFAVRTAAAGVSWLRTRSSFMCYLGIKKGRTDVRPEGRWLVGCAVALFLHFFV